MTDNERLEAVAVPSEQCVTTELLDRHGDAVRGLLRRLCRDEADADDVYQETAVKVLQNVSAVNGVRNPRAWLSTVAYRTFLDCRKRKQLPTVNTDAPDRRGVDPALHVLRSEEREAVRRAIESLPDHLREVLVLHYTGELSLQQTAEAMEIAVGTVKSRLNQALMKLRRQLT